MLKVIPSVPLSSNSMLIVLQLFDWKFASDSNSIHLFQPDEYDIYAFLSTSSTATSPIDSELLGFALDKTLASFLKTAVYVGVTSDI